MKKIKNKAALIKISSGITALLAVFIIVSGQPQKNINNNNKISVTHISRSVEPNFIGSYLSAKIAEKEGKYEKASEFYSKALSFLPDNPQIQGDSITTLARIGKVEAALKLAENSFSNKAPGIMVMKATQLAKEGEYTRAREAISSLSPSTVSGILLPAMNAWLLAGEGRFVEAKKILSSSLTDEASTPIMLYHMGLLSELAGSDDMADINYSTSLDTGQYKAQRVVEIYGNYLKKHGKRSAALKAYEEFAKASGNNWFAREAIRNIDSKEPIASITSAKDGLAELLFNLASMVYDTDDSGEAYIYINLSLYLRPDFANAQLMKGLFLESDGRYAEAINIYSGINSNSLFSLRAKYQQAACLTGMGRADDAVLKLKSLVNDRPDLADIHTQIGDILRSEEKYSEAAKEYSNAIAKADDHTPAWVLYYSRAVSLERTSQWQAAENDFKKALEFEPNQPDVLNYLSYSWLERDVNVKLALANLEKAVAARPNQAHILDSYGWALFKNGMVSESIEQLEAALELKPDDPFINDHLGDAFWKAGREREARYQWSRALRYNPGTELAANIDSKLKNGLVASAKTASIASTGATE